MTCSHKTSIILLIRQALTVIALFHLSISCLRRCKIYSPLYQLMSKKQIQAEYLLTDDSLSMMSFVTKPNPYNPNWTAMKMYLRKHAYLKAMKRFGDEEALKKEIERRKQEQYQRALNQSEDLFTESSSSLDSTRKRKSGDASGDKSLDDEKNDDDGLSKKKKKVKKTRQKMAGLISAISGK